MKCLYLICNAHLDPVWMWDWPEGAATAISTFYSAVELSEEFDYIFCHNEALLYEYIEKYDPELFFRIGKLIRAGKWKIMGGWYLQPDCIAPSGESLIRQIYLGKKYFTEKFGVSSSVAVNVDSFGHSRGIVQILKKCGYDSYLFCRPYPREMELPQNPFIWEGYDGSEVSAFRAEGEGTYSSPLGYAKENIQKKLRLFDGKDFAMILWGVGNHGGGPSRKDLKDIEELRRVSPFPVFHSWPEEYFASVSPKVRLAESLQKGCFIKSYSSLSRIKQKHTELENALFQAEKMSSAAALIKGKAFPSERFDEAMKALAFSEFHDILSGTCAQDGEKSTLGYLDYGLRLVEEIRTEAFFALSEDFERAKDGEYPIFIFNPNPYETEAIVEAEFLILNAIVSDEEGYEVTAFCEGKRIPLQVVKELSNINYDRRKRVAVKLRLKSMEITRVDLSLAVVKKKPVRFPAGDITVKDAYKEITVDRKTGLIRSYKKGGEELVKGNLFAPYLFDDNADPWGLGLRTVGENMLPFALSDGTEPLFRNLESCRVTEDGEVLTQVESNFVCEGISLRLIYKIYKNMPFTDVHCDVFYNDKLKGVRLGFDVAGGAEAETVFGREMVPQDGGEYPMQRFLRFENGLCVLNSGTFSCMADGERTYFTLLNGSCYCAHKIDDRPLIDYTRFILPTEAGIHHFEYRIGWLPQSEEESAAIRFNQRYYALNHFPHGKGRQVCDKLFETDEKIALISLRKTAEGCKIRLFNNSKNETVTLVKLAGISAELHFSKFEVKTLLIRDGKILECEWAVDNESF